jgi:hypothetical protein
MRSYVERSCFMYMRICKPNLRFDSLAVGSINPRMLRERTRPGLLKLLLFLTIWLSAENFSAFAQNSDATAADHEHTKEAQTAEQLAEAERLLKGPAGNPECVWLGRRVVSLLWRGDMDTAFRHLDLYDRFGCPGDHIQATFRCLVRNGNIDPKDAETLNGRVHACWVNPSLLAAPEQTTPSSATH